MKNTIKVIMGFGLSIVLFLLIYCKKFILGFLLMVFSGFLISCSVSYDENVWFDDDLLETCIVPDLPKITNGDYLKENNDIYFNMSIEEKLEYVNTVYSYLKTQNFKYFGTRGEEHSSLVGALTSYYFKPGTELIDFTFNRVETGKGGSTYIFVYSNGEKEDGMTIFNIIIIGIDIDVNIEYGNKEFVSNGYISVNKGYENTLNGQYFLEEEIKNQ